MNPCGFENNTLICNPFGMHNPNLGLLMRKVSVMNQFALIYLDLNINTHTNNNTKNTNNTNNVNNNNKPNSSSPSQPS
jgi:hypothetical protein